MLTLAAIVLCLVFWPVTLFVLAIYYWPITLCLLILWGVCAVIAGIFNTLGAVFK